ncbi:MAG: hypothetical protein H6627_00085 [Calditrichae bacterium]|nr:hypothetical protein [Calditrichia bacterium]
MNLLNIIKTLLFFVICLNAQQSEISFRHLNVTNGLSQNTINATYQDSRGFIWVGTQDGLNRYDGYEFRIYRNDPDKPQSLQSNWIWSIDEDSSANMWISTFGGGLSCYNRSAEEFITFNHNPDDSLSISHDTIWDFAEYPRGTFWVAANNGLNRMKLRQTDSLQARFEYIPHDTINTNIFSIVHAEGPYLWLTTFSGLYRFNINTYEYTFYELEAGVKDYGRLGGQFSNSGYLWLNSPKRGLFKFNLANSEVTHYKHDPENQDQSIYSSYVISVCEDNVGVVWVGTSTKLTLIFPDGRYRHYGFDPVDPGSISHDYITNIYQSQDGTVWLGTRGGLDLYNCLTQKFEHKKFRPDSKTSFSSPNITGFLEDSAGDFWIATNNGLSRRDKTTGHFKHYFTDDKHPENGPGANYILDLLEDSRMNIWVATRNGGISVWQRKSDTFKHFNKNKMLMNGVVLSIYEDSENKIWIGTNSNGLFCYNPADESIVSMPANPADPQDKMNDISVFSIFESSTGQFFVGTAAGGINIADRKTATFKHLLNKKGDRNSLSNNRVLCFCETQKGDIWVGTAQGLNLMIPDNNGSYYFKQYRIKDGLPNEVIYGIMEDSDEFLWISTNNGIAKINVQDTFNVKVFHLNDGLQGNEFNQNAWYKDSDERFYFGGSNGYNVFNPLHINLNDTKPRILLTHLRVLDKEVLPTASGILKETISDAAEITLPWQSNVFSIEFSALNYIMPERNQYAYIMEGFDKDWVFSGNRRFATYTNLNAGTYTFRVKASNNDDLWNEVGAALIINVMPPPWRSWWAYLFYSVSFITLIFGFIRFKVREKDKELETFARIEKAKSEERALVRKKASADFHDEAGNLITKITLLSTLARRSLKDKDPLYTYLDKISENAKQISGSMRDFIWVLDPDKDTLFDTISRLEDFCLSMFEFTNIQFVLSGLKVELKNIFLSLDERRAILLIFKEATNNCVKYSDATKAWIDLSFEKNCLKISFNDNGKGFDDTTQEKGYGLSNMTSRGRKINALVKISSEISMGTRVEFSKQL